MWRMQPNENIQFDTNFQPQVATPCNFGNSYLSSAYRSITLRCKYYWFNPTTTTMDSPHRTSSAESVSVKEEKEKPWKYIGYKVFSRWIASDPAFFVVRRFATLNARVALSLQDEIVQLEEKLDYMDKTY